MVLRRLLNLTGGTNMPDNKTRECSACKVQVSADLSYCPLCGKYLLLNEGDKIEKKDSSFPDYDYTYINRGKWVRTIKTTFINASLICFLINILFGSKPYWFPYVIASLALLYLTVFLPFKRENNFLQCLVRSAVLCSLFLIFIDFYNYKMWGTIFGWSFVYAAPSVLTAFSIVIGILGLSLRKYDVLHFYASLVMILLSGIYLGLKFLFFETTPAWATLMFVCASVIVSIVLLTFKYKKVLKDMLKRFHI